MKQLYIALNAYAVDFKQYPMNMQYSSPVRANSLQEDLSPATEAVLDRTSNSSNFPGTYPSNVYYNNATLDPLPPSASALGLASNSPLARVVSRKYLGNAKAATCPGGFKNANRQFTNGFFVWNGPHSCPSNLNNNGQMTNISWFGRHCIKDRYCSSGGQPNSPSFRYWGIRYGMSKYETFYGMTYPISDVGFYTCPSIYETAAFLSQEPHDAKMIYNYQHFYGDANHNNQLDRFPPRVDDGTLPDVGIARNLMYGDGHAEFIHSNSRKRLRFDVSVK